MMKKLLTVSLPVVVLDQAIKALIRRQPLGATLFELPGLLTVTHSVNTGAAFSMLSGRPALLAALSLLLLALLCLYVRRTMRLTRRAQYALCLLLGGGAGNLIDRVAFSGVTDYLALQLFDFPIFNLADVAITGSVGALLLLLLTGKLETTGEKHGSDDRTDG